MAAQALEDGGGLGRAVGAGQGEREDVEVGDGFRVGCGTGVEPALEGQIDLVDGSGLVPVAAARAEGVEVRHTPDTLAMGHEFDAGRHGEQGER